MGLHTDSSRAWRGLVHVSLDVRTCCERCASKRSGCTTTYILYQQNLGRYRDEVSAFGEVGVGISSCHEEDTPLLSGSYYLCINQLSSIVIIKEI